ncbi:hypothetical protein RZS08_54615, partial [Arthrospira platensis SPKY1]|nr:hypothetical protein [Arthrospira platensis SPKY1]
MTTLDADFASPLSFGTGRSAERVFWRHNREFGGNWALPVHAAHVLGSLLFRPLHAAAYSHAIGRVMAALERSSYREFDRRLQRAGEACHRSEPTS